MFDNVGVDRSDRKISAHATLETTPNRYATTSAVPKTSTPVPAQQTPQRPPVEREKSDLDIRRRNKGKAPPPPQSGGDTPRTPTPVSPRPKSSVYSNSGSSSPASVNVTPGSRKKNRVTTTSARTLQPLPSSPRDEIDDDDNGEISDDSLDVKAEKGEKRLSPEKEMALQTLDDVLKEAEESMGEILLSKLHL